MRWPFTRSKKSATRPSKQAVRQYSGASLAARFGDFNASNLSADAELRNNIEMLRNRSRDLARNNPHLVRFIKLMENNIVGSRGFALQVKAKNANGGTDRAGNARVEEQFRLWSRKVTGDGMMSMREATNLAVRTWCRDGEVFVQKIHSKRFRDTFRLFFIEADQIDHTLNQTNAQTGNSIRMGVEVDGWGAPVAYYALTYHPGDADWATIGKRKYRRIPADEIIHTFIKSRPGQTRGEPPMAPIMTDSKMLAGYRDAEITNRRVAAAKMGFFVQREDAGPIAGVADSIDASGQLEMEVEPGKLSTLPMNTDFRSWDPGSSSTDYAQFEKQIIRSIATGLGPSYIDLAMDLEGVNYSSIRQGALADRDFYRGMQAFFVEQFAFEVYGEWLDRAMQFGDLSIPSSRYDKFYDGSHFRPRGWSWVDPMKETNAAVKAIENNITSLTQVIGDTGRDHEDVFTELQDEQALLKEKNLTPKVEKAPPVVKK
jgi:lambda family phage portal protein